MNQTLSDKSLNASPIFVVGAPRSGTSILTWCLGQHESILSTEESNWIGDFSVYSAVTHAMGSAREDRSQLSACGIRRDVFLESLGELINQLILNSTSFLVENGNRQAEDNPSLVNQYIQIAREEEPKKRRWIDGTPEYSLCIPALLALFPKAKFIHIIRDVESVVLSLIRLRSEKGQPIVNNLDDAFQYWYKCVLGCNSAEEAWGSKVVHRILYKDLIVNPRARMKEILTFLGVSSSIKLVNACIEPLNQRINSSHVPTGDETDLLSRLSPDHKMIREFSLELTSRSKKYNHNQEKISRQIALFEQRIEFVKNLDAEYQTSQEVYVDLERQFNERTDWALELDSKLSLVNQKVIELEHSLEERADWALSLDREILERDQTISRLQAELDERTNWALRLNTELSLANQKVVEREHSLEERADWALSLDSEILERDQTIRLLQAQLDERSNWALQLDTELSLANQKVVELEHSLKGREDSIHRS